MPPARAQPGGARLGEPHLQLDPDLLIDDLEALLRPEPVETVSLQQALAELPRLLDTGARRRSGAFRPLGEMLPSSTKDVTPAATVAMNSSAPVLRP